MEAYLLLIQHGRTSCKAPISNVKNDRTKKNGRKRFESNINLNIILRIKTTRDRFLVIHEFIKALKARYNQENIEISWPIRKLYQIK